jgi:DNA primase catalytic core
MAKTSQSQLDRIKRELKIKELAEEQGLKLARKNGQFVTRCLWHSDKTPSLFIHPTKNLFNCFGCDAGGDSIQWVMKSFKMDFARAIEYILNRYPHLKEAETETVSPEKVKAETCPLKMDCSDQKFIQQVVEFYHQRLLNDYSAQDYLQKRGILDNEAIKAHKIGFADRDLGRAIPNAQRKAGKEMRTRLADLGIYRRQTGHGHFNGCVVFPVIDCTGNVREIYGRKVNDNLRKGTDYHLYLSKAARLYNDRGIWNEQALAVHSEIILCESIIDAMSFWVAGYKNVTAIYGTNGFTDYHRDALAKYKTKTVLLALDRDDEGAAAVKRISKSLLESGVNVYRVDFPKATVDANAYLQVAGGGYHGDLKTKSVHDWMGLVIRNATWLGQGEPVAIQTEVPDFIARAREEIANDPTEAEAGASKAAKEKTAAVESSPTAVADSSLAAKLAAAVDPIPARQEPKVPSVEAEVKDNEIAFVFGDRQYRVRGLEKNHSYDTLKINLLCRREDHFHVDTFDLYQSRPRATFIKVASLELGHEDTIIKRDLGQILLKLEQLQEQQIESLLKANQRTEVELKPAEKEEALKLLKDENLLTRILSDFDACGVVGEETNKLIGYLAAVSRKLNDPLAVLIQSSSAAGKSSLMDAVLAFVPEEDKVIYSAMTGQSLYYMGGGDLKHKILAISEEEGVRQASYALKLLQSEGSLRIASTGKDPNTGRMETQEYTVEGPVMLFLTTTSYDIDEELQNRCLTVSVCEDRAQTQAIHDVQRKRQTIQGLLSNQNRTAIQTVHQNAQRLLKPLLVANNFAEELKFRSDRTRTRRDHAKYLCLIRVIALLHQHQRKIKTVEHNGEQIEYIEATRDDIAKADELAAAILSSSYEELPERTQFVLNQVHELMVKTCNEKAIKPSEFRFTRRELRTATGLGNTQLKLHLDRLEDLEYLNRLKRSGSNPTIVYAVIEIDEVDSKNEPSFTGDESHLRGSFGVTPEKEKPVTTPEKNGQLLGVG